MSAWIKCFGPNSVSKWQYGRAIVRACYYYFCFVTITLSSSSSSITCSLRLNSGTMLPNYAHCALFVAWRGLHKHIAVKWFSVVRVIFQYLVAPPQSAYLNNLVIYMWCLFAIIKEAISLSLSCRMVTDFEYLKARIPVLDISGLKVGSPEENSVTQICVKVQGHSHVHVYLWSGNI